MTSPIVAASTSLAGGRRTVVSLIPGGVKETAAVEVLLKFQAKRLNDSMLDEALKMHGGYGVALSLDYASPERMTEVFMEDLSKFIPLLAEEWNSLDMEGQRNYGLSFHENAPETVFDFSVNSALAAAREAMTKLWEYQEWDNDLNWSESDDFKNDIAPGEHSPWGVIDSLDMLAPELDAYAVNSYKPVRELMSEQDHMLWEGIRKSIPYDDASIPNLFETLRLSVAAVFLVEDNMVKNWSRCWGIYETFHNHVASL